MKRHRKKKHFWWFFATVLLLGLVFFKPSFGSIFVAILWFGGTYLAAKY